MANEIAETHTALTSGSVKVLTIQVIDNDTALLRTNSAWMHSSQKCT